MYSLTKVIIYSLKGENIYFSFHITHKHAKRVKGISSSFLTPLKKSHINLVNLSDYSLTRSTFQSTLCRHSGHDGAPCRHHSVYLWEIPCPFEELWLLNADLKPNLVHLHHEGQVAWQKACRVWPIPICK